MFDLSTEPIDPGCLANALGNPRAGALATFEGWVRNHHNGRAVEGLEYEAFAAMARSVGQSILDEACLRFGLLGARAAHRIGPVAVGERAVWVGATAVHRRDAFLACRWIMDRIKQDVPIWKRETFADDRSSVWVRAGEPEAPVDPAVDPRYARQVALPDLGPAGQRRLAAARVLVVGAGGLGGPALQYLAAAGVGSLTVCDGDRVDESNLHRQILFGVSDIGRNKAEAAADRLREMNPMISVEADPDAATPDRLSVLLRDRDVVLDCTDSFEARYAIHDACWNAGLPLVQAAVYQFDGQVQVIDPAAGAGCYRCLWPDPPEPGCVGNCAQTGVLGVTPGLLGVWQAAQTILVLLGRPEALRTETLYVDVLGGILRRVRREPRADCCCRSGTPWPIHPARLLDPGPTADRILREAVLVDLREPGERVGDPAWIRALSNVPAAEWAEIPARFPHRPLVLFCAAGVRARRCLAQLGYPHGIYAWTRSPGELSQPDQWRPVGTRNSGILE